MSNLYRIVIPSTANESAPITPFEHSERVKQVFIFLSRLNGGATSINGFGGWVDDNKQIIGENVVIVESYGDDAAFSKIERYCKLLRVAWSQNCIGLQVLPCNMLFV